MPYLTNRNSILEAISAHPGSARRLWIESGHERSFEEVIKAAREAGVSFRILPAEAFTKRFKKVRSHVCLERDELDYVNQDVYLQETGSEENPLICAFDGIYDPQNLGNIIRSAAGLGIGSLIIPQDRSCGITDTVVTVSRGAVEHVRIVRVTNIARYLDQLKRIGVFCYGLDERGSEPLFGLDLRGPTCLVFGNEEGLRRLTRETCDVVIKIPTDPAFPSLNVATSFAIAVYEARRQRSAVLDR